jgi:hypothetical protein
VNLDHNPLQHHDIASFPLSSPVIGRYIRRARVVELEEVGDKGLSLQSLLADLQQTSRNILLIVTGLIVKR